MTAATIIRPRRLVFPGSAEQVGRARQFVDQVLGECPAADDAVLLTSELVTNAVTHTASGRGGKIVVTIYRADTRVRVEVRDDGSDQVPVVRAYGLAEESGCGLGLVELMAQCWGTAGDGAAGSCGSCWSGSLARDVYRCGPSKARFNPGT